MKCLKCKKEISYLILKHECEFKEWFENVGYKNKGIITKYDERDSIEIGNFISQRCPECSAKYKQVTIDGNYAFKLKENK